MITALDHLNHASARMTAAIPMGPFVSQRRTLRIAEKNPVRPNRRTTRLQLHHCQKVPESIVAGSLLQSINSICAMTPWCSPLSTRMANPFRPLGPTKGRRRGCGILKPAYELVIC
jgi:hypothetical protein